MRTLHTEEVEYIDGGLIPAVYAGFLAYNYVVATYSATQIAFAVGTVVGAGSAIAAALD